MEIKKIIDGLTLEQKARLCSGADFRRTKAVERILEVTDMYLRSQKTGDGIPAAYGMNTLVGDLLREPEKAPRIHGMPQAAEKRFSSADEGEPPFRGGGCRRYAAGDAERHAL